MFRLEGCLGGSFGFISCWNNIATLVELASLLSDSMALMKHLGSSGIQEA